MNSDSGHQIVSKNRDARLKAIGVATPARLVIFSIITGGFCGIIAAAVALSLEFYRNPLGTIMLSFGFGCFVGTICSPIPVLTLRRHRFWSVAWFIFGLVTPLTCVVAMFSSSLSQLMLLSGVAFAIAVVLARFALQRVWLGEGVCWQCGYDLRGSQDAIRCPECATLIRIPEHTLPKPWRRVPIASIGVLISLSYAVTMLLATWHDQRPKPFTKAAWSAAPPTSRLPMARDLVAKGTVTGLTEDEVFKLLGTPTSRYDCDAYSLGERSALVVTYDANEVVRTAMGSSFPKGVVDEDFNADLWAAGTPRERLRMGRSLFTHRNPTLASLSRDQVHALLGKPQRRRLALYYAVSQTRGAVVPNRKRLQQSLLMGNVPTRLVLTFEDGRVESTRLPVES